METKRLLPNDCLDHSTDLVELGFTLQTANHRTMMNRFAQTFGQDADGNNPQEAENNVDEQIERLLEGLK